MLHIISSRPCFTSFGCLLRSRTEVELLDCTVVLCSLFLRDFHAVFHRGCTISHLHQQWRKFQVFHSLANSLFLFFLPILTSYFMRVWKLFLKNYFSVVIPHGHRVIMNYREWKGWGRHWLAVIPSNPFCHTYSISPLISHLNLITWLLTWDSDCHSQIQFFPQKVHPSLPKN